MPPVELLFWGVLGLLGGAVLGLIATPIGRPGWWSAAASALVMGLLLADAYLWNADYGDDLPMAFALGGVGVITALGHRTWRQIGYTAALLGPGTVAGYLVISLPDWAQAYFRL